MHKIVTQVLNDAGYDQAITGISLCHKITPEKARSVAQSLCARDGGHNKFLESIIVWVMVQATRYWWQEADTYRLSTKQSESTMHTLVKELKTLDNDEDTTLITYGMQNFEECPKVEYLRGLRNLAIEGNLREIKAHLPEGFLQRRVWCFSYKTLRNMILQRRNHRLPHWPDFLKTVLENIEHPELLPGVEDAD